MARRLYTVQNLIDEVRSLIDEENQDTVDDSADILPALNRAQDYAVEILAKHYEDPLIKTVTIALGAVAEIDIPEDIYSDRIEKVEFELPPNRFQEVRRISFRDLTYYESTAAAVSVPYYYAIVGRRIRFVPTPNGTYDARIWYVRQPDDLVIPQGRITRVDQANNRVTVDSIGSSLTTETDNLQSFVNVIDGQTGEVKASLLIKTLDDNVITFKSDLTGNPLLDADGKVLNRTISTDISQIFKLNSSSVLAIEPNDYICSISGTCVPFFARPLGNFLIQYAVADIKGTKLEGPEDLIRQVLEKFEVQVERTWAGREQQLRVKKRSKHWGLPYRRVWWDTSR